MCSVPDPSTAVVPSRKQVTTPSIAPARGHLTLLQKVAGMNALMVIVAAAVSTVVLAPAKVSSLAVDEEAVVLGAAVALVVLANAYLLRRLIGPIQALTALARRADLNAPGQRIPDAKPNSEAGELALAFNEMLSRLETERREATARILDAQEAERLRIAQELHDQVGQELTAVLLGLSRVEAHAPDMLASELAVVQDVVRASLDDVRRNAIELRPQALEDLGLPGALAVLAQRLREPLGLEVRETIATDLPALTAETELVVYRVAHEALTNAARHSGSDAAELMLTHDNTTLTLTVRDEGRGLSPEHVPGTGMRGMRERAGLLGARLAIRNRTAAAGCEVRLEIPLRDGR